MRNIYLDTETTGFKPGQIAELTMIVEDTDIGGIVDRKNYFFTVDSMDSGAQEAHGFTIEELARLSNGKKFADYATEIYNILNGNCIIAHNVSFDLNFISTELWRCNITYGATEKCCTMKTFKNILKITSKYPKYGKYKNPKLEEVLSFLNIDTNEVDKYSREIFNYDGSKFHDSRFDTTGMYIAVNVYREILQGKNTGWQSRFCK